MCAMIMIMSPFGRFFAKGLIAIRDATYPITLLVRELGFSFVIALGASVVFSTHVSFF